jgi:hypothetical protein
VAPAAIKATAAEERAEGTSGVLGMINIDAYPVHTSEEFRQHFVFFNDTEATPSGVTTHSYLHPLLSIFCAKVVIVIFLWPIVGRVTMQAAGRNSLWSTFQPDVLDDSRQRTSP